MTWMVWAVLTGVVAPWVVIPDKLARSYRERGVIGAVAGTVGAALVTVPVSVAVWWTAWTTLSW